MSGSVHYNQGGVKMYGILDFAKLPTISHLIWDIDGTITDENGEVNQEVAAKIIRLALNGVYHSFITGRDAAWIIKNVITPMKKFYNFPRVVGNLVFFAEVGCVMITVDANGAIFKVPTPVVQNHPLCTNQDGIRQILADLAYNPKDPDDRFTAGRVLNSPLEVIYDADRVPWVIDHSKEKAPKCHPYIWSSYKEVFATFEKIRDSDGRIKTFDQDMYAGTIAKAIEMAGLQDQVDVEVVSTAINIVPKVAGVKFGKAWAAGKALEYIWRAKLGEQPLLETVIDRTIAVGDGKADLDFTIPAFADDIQRALKRSTIFMIYVGAEADLPRDGELLKNIIIKGTGRGTCSLDERADVIRFERAKGARVVNAVLNFLKEWEQFSRF